MVRITRGEGHLLVAAIRVLAHRLERSPTPEEVADLLQMAASPVRSKLAQLADLGAVSLVQSAFEEHAAVKDMAALEELPAEEGPAIDEDLRDFDRRKREEADRMAQLFDSGEHERQRQDQLQRMDDELKSFKQKKKPNPFGD
jgi:hypothetical protein